MGYQAKRGRWFYWRPLFIFAPESSALNNHGDPCINLRHSLIRSLRSTEAPAPRRGFSFYQGIAGPGSAQPANF